MERATVLVTGGTGFFGHNLVAALLVDDRVGRIKVYARNLPPTEAKLSRWPADGSDPLGDTVEKCAFEDRVVQSDEPNRIFSDPRVIFCQGDITDRVALREAMDGCSIVFHACGDTRWWNAVNEEQHRTNVTGTLFALELAVASSTVKRFVYTSTVDVMGTGHGIPLSEVQQGTPFAYNYATTKRRAEDYVLKQAYNGTKRDFRITIIRPGSMLGPWDVTDQYGRLFAELKHRQLLGVPCGGTSVCHVGDVARAHIQAAFAPSLAGIIYVCAGKNMTYRELFRSMRARLDGADTYTDRIGPCCVPCEVMPETVLVLYGWLCELHSNWWSRKAPEVNPGMARYLSQYAYYTSDMASRHLDYPLQDAGQWAVAIHESYEWYRRRGRL